MQLDLSTLLAPTLDPLETLLARHPTGPLANLIEPDAPPADAALEAFPGSLAHAETKRERFDLRGYARTRNHLEGGVSRLNPYVTWGVYTPRELLDDVASRHGRHDKDLAKFTSEIGWKAYFREGFRALGARVYRSLEPYKYPRAEDEPGLPPGIETAETGLDCIDTLVTGLLDTGYLHNHGRMWLAAWWVHYARHAWQDGEAFLYRHLLDGEPGPNALSWQWVASTYAGKPYAFNVENMHRFGLNGCDGTSFDVTYDELDARFFSGHREGGYARRGHDHPSTVPGPPRPDLLRPPTVAPLVVLHAERLSTRAHVLLEHPDAPVAVYLDARRLERERPSRKRLAFAVRLAADLVTHLRDDGRTADLFLLEDEAELAHHARTLTRDGFVAPDSWHPGTWNTLGRLDTHAPVAVTPDAPLAEVQADLRSFSSYWRKAEGHVTRRLGSLFS